MICVHVSNDACIELLANIGLAMLLVKNVLLY